MLKTIWSNNQLTNQDYLDWLESYKEHLVSFQDEDEEEVKELDIYDDNFNEWLNDTLDMHLDDERGNLDIQLDHTIIAIADLGLWNGRRQGYKLLGNNINKCLESDCDYVSWYCNSYDMVGVHSHHDGTNYITYRELKDEKFLDIVTSKAYNGTLTKKDISRYTRSLVPHIKEVYGW